MTEAKKFHIEAKINDQTENIRVAVAETTDGAPYYICSIDGKEITQLRKEETGWEQIWGDLNEKDIDSVGNAIAASPEFE